MDIEEQYDKIYHYCYFKIYDKQLAQDITQETFLRFYKQELNFDSSKHLPYLYTIARNLCIDEFRKKAIESLENFQDEAIYDPCEEWVDNLTLRTIIQKMPLEEQELIFLRLQRAKTRSLKRPWTRPFSSTALPSTKTAMSIPTSP